MLPNGGHFKRFQCPDGNRGECSRPYCHYGGHSSNSEFINIPPITIGIKSSEGDGANDPNSIKLADSPNDEPPSYSTVQADQFQGYHGYFATSSSPPPAVSKRPLLPTPAVRPSSCAVVRPSQQPRRTQQQPIQQQQQQSQKKVASSRPIAASQQNQRESNLNDMARDLAAINNEIERLQRKLTHSSEQDEEIEADDDETGNGEDEDIADDPAGYDPETPATKRARLSESIGVDSASSANNATDSSSDELYLPKRAATSSSGKMSSYKPTPIQELQKSTNKLLKDSWKTPATNDAKPPKSVQPTKRKPTGSKSATLLDKKGNDTSTVADLFGDDSDVDSSTSAGIVEGQRRNANKSTRSNSKEDPDDMASIIDDLIAPTNTIRQKQAAKVIAIKKETAPVEDVDLDRKKKRVAQVSDASMDVVKKLRESGGERQRGQMMTPRQQLESRFANLKKAQEELKAKEKQLKEELQKNEATEQPTKVQLSAGRAKTPVVAQQKAMPSGDIGTNRKGEKRMARIPKVSEKPTTSSQRPIIPLELGAKVPTNVRQQYLNLIVDECSKFMTQSDAYSKAMEVERAVYERATSKAGYLNAVVNAIKRIRDQEVSATGAATDNQPVSKKAGAGISHSTVIAGKPASKYTYTIGRSGGATTGTAAASTRSSSEEFYEALLHFVLNVDQQMSNGYPRPDKEKPGFAVYFKEEVKKMYVDDSETKRICARCGQPFQITQEGEYICRHECLFHWGRAWKKRVAGMVESRYNCCQGDLNSAGCSVSEYHVSDCMPRRMLAGYVYTNDWRNGNSSVSRKVYALDCEMVYTTCGSEVARVTVVDDRCQVVYERCIRPENRILDYNSRFSGLTEEKLMQDDTVVTLDEVHNELAQLFTADTILIGHSLESDCRVLKLIHDKVVDTSIVFPHRLGAPYKRALKTLAGEFLKRIIQDDVSGHDSKEDASTCMDLMKWRIKQDAGRPR